MFLTDFKACFIYDFHVGSYVQYTFEQICTLQELACYHAVGKFTQYLNEPALSQINTLKKFLPQRKITRSWKYTHAALTSDYIRIRCIVAFTNLAITSSTRFSFFTSKFQIKVFAVENIICSSTPFRTISVVWGISTNDTRVPTLLK